MASHSVSYPHRPRQHLVDADALHVQIQRQVDGAGDVHHATLIDISRHGFCVQTSTPLDDEEAVVLRLRDDNSGMDLTLAGTVRWQREPKNDTWLIGCSADQELAWETLGELFLNGILCADETA